MSQTCICVDCIGTKKKILTMMSLVNKEITVDNTHCPRCNGRGVISYNVVRWIQQGHALRRKRKLYKSTLENAAKRINVSVSTLTAMENGFIDNDHYFIREFIQSCNEPI